MHRATHTGRPVKLDLCEIALLADSIFVKELGMQPCKFPIATRYVSWWRELNTLDVWITDRDFEPIPGEAQILQ